MHSSISGGKNHDGMLLMVASLLLIVLIYSSITGVDIFAKPPKGPIFACTKSAATISGAAYAETCCQFINGKAVLCNKCNYNSDGNQVGDCTNFHPNTPTGPNPSSTGTLLPPGNNTGGVTNGQTGPPRHLGTELPSGSNNNTGTPPALTVTKEHNTASPNVLSSTGNSNPSASNGQGQQPSEHHHKGEQNGAGTSSTGNSQSGSTNNNPSSGGNNNGKSDSGNNKNSKK